MHIAKTVLITGATSGIGRELTIYFAAQGWDLVLVNRNSGKSKALQKHIQNKFPSRSIKFYIADFADLHQVKHATEHIINDDVKIDLLINNAGGIFKSGEVGFDNLEPHFSVNYLATVLFTMSLLPCLSKEGHIVFTSSVAYQFGRLNANHKQMHYWFQGYANSKLALNLFVNHVVKEKVFEDVKIHLFHPGIIGTAIFFKKDNWMKKYLMPVANIIFNTPRSVANQYFAIIRSKPFLERNGLYFDKGKITDQKERALDIDLQEALYNWTISFLTSRQLL